MATTDRYCPNCAQMVRPKTSAAPMTLAVVGGVGFTLWMFIQVTFGGGPVFWESLRTGFVALLFVAFAANQVFGLQRSCPICKSDQLEAAPPV